MAKGIKAKEQNQLTMRRIHPYWNELIEYVAHNGGFVKLEIRFQHGVPIMGEKIREQVRFDVKNIQRDIAVGKKSKAKKD